MTIQELRSQITSASNILILLPYLIDYDAISSTALLANLVNKNSDKKVSIASSQTISDEFVEILKKVGVENSQILKTIDPISYVITVADIQDKVNVSWNRNNGNLDLVLVPEKGEVDFSKITNSRQGGTYDLVLVINTAKANHLGQIYTRHQGLFGNYNLVSIGKDFELEDESVSSITAENYSSTSELIFDNYLDLDGEIDENIAEIAAYGLIGRTDGLQRIKSSKTFEILSTLATKYNLNLGKIFQTFNSKLSKSDLLIEERVIRNLKVDESRKVIYSSLATTDFNALNFNPDNFDGSKFIPKNVKGDYEYAFIAYEKGLNHTLVLIQALNPENNLAEISSRLNAYPNTSYALAEFMTNSDQAIAQTLKAISGEELAEISLQSSVNSDQSVEKGPQSTDYGLQSSNSSLQVEEVKSVETSDTENQEAKSDSTSNLNSEEKSREESEASTAEVIQNQPVISSTPFTSSTATTSNDTNASNQNPVPSNSPFVRASELVVDQNAKPVKESNYFSSTDKPFDKAGN